MIQVLTRPNKIFEDRHSKSILMLKNQDIQELKKSTHKKSEIDAKRMGPLPVEKKAFKRKFETKWIKIILKHQTHIHDKNVSIF